MNQRGDEDGLAGVREAGHPEPDRRIEQMAAELREGSSSQPDLFKKLVHNRGFRRSPAAADQYRNIDGRSAANCHRRVLVVFSPQWRARSWGKYGITNVFNVRRVGHLDPDDVGRCGCACGDQILRYLPGALSIWRFGDKLLLSSGLPHAR